MPTFNSLLESEQQADRSYKHACCKLDAIAFNLKIAKQQLADSKNKCLQQHFSALQQVRKFEYQMRLQLRFIASLQHDSTG